MSQNEKAKTGQKGRLRPVNLIRLKVHESLTKHPRSLRSLCIVPLLMTEEKGHSIAIRY